MIHYSPLRYPGGKAKFANHISKICSINGINKTYVEPYVGGASVGLYLLINKLVNKIIINDIDRSIYAFWYSVLNESEILCKRIERTKITINEWKIQKKIQKNKNNEDLLDLGFSTLFLNRCNFSGIINAGPIGGIKQKSEYKIDSRFNKPKIIERINRITQYRKKIRLLNMDTLDLLKSTRIKKLSKNSILYLDPPYYVKGKCLYENHYNDEDHKKIADKIREIDYSNWIVSYDNVKPIRDLYRGVKKKEITINHSAYKSKKGSEIMFFSKKIKMI